MTTQVQRRQLLLAALLAPVVAGWYSTLASASDFRIEGTHILDDWDPRVIKAKRILDDAPSTGTPFSVATYFIDSVPTEFQSAWLEPDPKHPTDANPVIVEFFRRMNMTPKGDTTAWCAAFVNWCLARVGILGTGSAGSQSFVSPAPGWGTTVWSKDAGGDLSLARTGDILVFTHANDPVHGHVAFFSKWIDESRSVVQMLGGNQITKTDHLHVIDFKALPVDGELYLRAILTARGLRTP